MPEKWWGMHDGIDFPHLVLSQQFNRDQLETLFDLASILKREVEMAAKVDWLTGKIIATLFYEPSTRTRFSFETAAKRLGADVISSENAAKFSSAVKGEVLSDTIKIMSKMADAIVMRHPETGSAKVAAMVLGASPIINGGDGKGQHPTQALLDIFTIREHFGRVDNLRVVMVGDLKHGRTVRSLAYMLSKFKNVKITFVAPEIVQMGDDIKAHLTKNKVFWCEERNLVKAVRKADAVYMTRYQLERAENEEEKQQLEEAKLTHIMTPKVASEMPKNSIIMHPLPRVEEISHSVDRLARAYYFKQAANGIPIRMAILLMTLNPCKAQELLNQN
jgi:aspartate carbamoyltransferase catalytic subunit